MKKIIVYKSSTGFTKRYSQWIGEELDCEVLPLEEVSAGKLGEYDLVIFGGGFMGGNVNGLPKIKKMYQGDMILFGTGATPQDATDMIEKAKQSNLTEEEQEKVPFFYMHSGLNYEKMGFASKMMMKLLKKMLAGKKDKSEEDMAMEKMIASSFDECDKKYIQPLVECVQSMEK